MRCLYDGDHPCGRCPACLANRQRGFMFRLDQEKLESKFYFWLTLQYDDEHVPRLQDGEMCFSKEHCRAFFEKLRKRYAQVGNTFKHFLVSEYGPTSTERPHYHCLLMVYNDLTPAQNYLVRKEMRDFIIHECWPNGHVTEKAFHGRVLRYITKYCCKPELTGAHHTMKPFTLISRGIGISLLDRIPEKQKKQMIDKLDFTYTYNGSKIQLPRYYVDKIMPHSLQDLRDAASSDLDRYRSLLDIRTRLQRKQSVLYRQAHQEQYSLDPTDFSGFEDLRKSSEGLRNYQFQIFRSKIKQRKNL